MTVGIARRVMHTFLIEPETSWIPRPGDVLESQKALYLVHSCHKVNSKIYPHRYSVLRSRLSTDDEVLGVARRLKIGSASKEYLEAAKRGAIA